MNAAQMHAYKCVNVLTYSVCITYTLVLLFFLRPLTSLLQQRVTMAHFCACGSGCGFRSDEASAICPSHVPSWRHSLQTSSSQSICLVLIRTARQDTYLPWLKSQTSSASCKTFQHHYPQPCEKRDHETFKLADRQQKSIRHHLE